MAVPDRQPGAGVSRPSADSQAGGRESAGAPNRPGGWKFVVSWIAFAITLLLTVWLGVEVVLGTKGFG